MAADTLPARVLIVEDDFLIRLTLAEALADEGYTVSEASSGEEALVLVAADLAGIALVLTDIQLGSAMNGLEFALGLREIAPHLPVIFMTGRPDALAGRLTARDRLIAKPYLPSQICALARELLAT